MPANPNCDGGTAHSSNPEVRRLPLSRKDGSALILCRLCFEHEIRWLRGEMFDSGRFYKLPKWEDLEIYTGE